MRGYDAGAGDETGLAAGEFCDVGSQSPNLQYSVPV